MILSTLVTIIVDILKGILSMILFFCRLIWSLIRLVLTILPLTGCLFTAVFLLQTAELILGRDPLPAVFPVHPDYTASTAMLHQIISWWNIQMTQVHASAFYLYVLFLLLTVILAVPVLGALLMLAAVSSAFSWLACCAVIDLIYALLRMIFAKVSPADQIRDRFYTLFPRIGDRHYDHSYHKWLRRHHEEFEQDPDEDDDDRHHRDHYDDDNYYDEDDDDYDDEEEDDDYDDEDDGEDDEDEDNNEDGNKRRSISGHFSRNTSAHRPLSRSEKRQRSYDRFYETDEETDEETDHETDSDSSTAKQNPEGNGFDFFAGCTTSESAEKKYHALVKLYHPDNMSGDTDALQQINIQYDQIRKKFH
jgi:hypothetical protein